MVTAMKITRRQFSSTSVAMNTYATRWSKHMRQHFPRTYVYVAAPWVEREEAQRVATMLRDVGFRVTSRWHALHPDSDDPIYLEEQAQNDWDDLHDAHAMVLINSQKSEGKAVEQGIAIANGIPIVAIGRKKNNIFQYLHSCYTCVDTAEEAADALSLVVPI
jgi:nucleoside 2-deoxyribosyltransferase